MLKFHQVSATPEWWARVGTFPDRLVYQTDEWINFIAETQGALPVYAEIRDGASLVGCFFSLIFSRYGVRIMGSPFPGWTTMYMGFNLTPGVPRWMALEALEQFAFHECGCLHYEVTDRFVQEEDGERLGLLKRFYSSYETDLTRSEEEIFSGMKPTCRTCVRKAAKSGVVVEQAQGDQSFVDDYYEQLKDVFAKQRRFPTYSIGHVSKLIERLHPTGNLLLLRARDSKGDCIATGIYPGMNKVAQFWGNASFRYGHHLRPNQALNWRALCYWRSRGVERFDWGGEGEYKEKYGPRKITVYRFCKSRIPMLPLLRDQAQNLYYQKERLKGWLACHGRGNGSMTMPHSVAGH